MGLTVSRYEGEDIRLLFDENMTAAELDELIRDGITISLSRVKPTLRHARIMVQAPQSVMIVRGELLRAT